MKNTHPEIMLLKILIYFFLTFPMAISVNADTDVNADGIWLLVDTQQLELSVKSGEETLIHFDNIAIGRNGSGFKSKRGDDTTPLGKYKVSWINRKSRFNLFYGFNYPSRENIQNALEKGLVNKKTYQQVISAHNNDKTPPQNTPIGGMLGIHGLGNADMKVHKTLNWTHGCIALTNEQIIILDKFIKENTIVVVK